MPNPSTHDDAESNQRIDTLERRLYEITLVSAEQARELAHALLIGEPT